MAESIYKRTTEHTGTYVAVYINPYLRLSARCTHCKAISLAYYKQQKPVYYSPYLPDARTSATGCSSLQPRHLMKAHLMHFPTSHQTPGLELYCRYSSYIKRGCLENQDNQVYYRDWLITAHTGTHSRYQACELVF